MMSTKLDWTQKLGDAVLAQQPDVMDAVQRLRARAQAQKKLQTTKEQKVSVKTEQSKQVIVIEPTQPETVYVPYYDPAVVYGAWPYAGLSALLLPAGARLLRRRRSRHRPCVRRGRRARRLGGAAATGAAT